MRSGSCVKKSERTSGYDVMTLPFNMRPIQDSYTTLPGEIIWEWHLVSHWFWAERSSMFVDNRCT